MAKLPYKIGDIFAFPLKDGKGFCLGVIAGMPRKGRVLLGYFYEKVYSAVPSGDDVPVLKPEHAIRIVRFGDLSLFNSDWPVVGHISGFDPRDWPSPKFLRERMLQLVTYANDDPQNEVTVERYWSDGNAYEEDGVSGAGWVEIVMTDVAGKAKQ